MTTKTKTTTVTATSLTVRNIKTTDGGDWGAMSATLHVNGNNVGAVSNDGWGGNNYYHHATREDEATFKAAAEAYLVDYENREGLDADDCDRLDTAVALIMDAKEMELWAKRQLRNGAVTVFYVSQSPAAQERTGKFLDYVALSSKADFSLYELDTLRDDCNQIQPLHDRVTIVAADGAILPTLVVWELA